MTSLITAVVPTFRPDADDVLALVDGLTAAGVPVVVSDDASPVATEQALRALAERGVPVVRHAKNAGIARSLNVGLQRARAAGSAWLLTVDQDSLLPDGYVESLREAIDQVTGRLGSRVGAIAAGRVDDDSGAFGYPVSVVDGVSTTPEVIQTGTAWNVEALHAIGGFDESFGIDAVDAAACVRLRAAGRLVVLAPELSIRHRIGHARAVRVFGRTVLATGHTPARRMTMVRNRVRLFPEEFAQSPRHAMRTMRRLAVNVALAVTVEEDRWAKAKSSARGLIGPHDR